MRTLPALTALSACLSACLCGCLGLDDDRRSGVDDFPNSIYARMDSFMAQSEQADEAGTVPAVNDSIFIVPSIKVPLGAVAAAKTGLGKIAARTDTLCKGTVTLSKSEVIGEKTVQNTAVLCVDSALTDPIQGNETVVRAKSVAVFKNGRVETVEIEDADGDSIVNPVAGRKSKEKILFTVTDSGFTLSTLVILGPGPDNKFDTEADNLLYRAEWTKTAGKDTLAYARYTDPDGDGIVIDNAKPSLVDLEFFQRGPTPDHRDAEWSRASLRLVVVYKVEPSEVKRARFEAKTTDGRTLTSVLRNRQGGEDIDRRDTLEAHLEVRASLARDSLDSMETVFVMSHGRNLEDGRDDSLYAFKVQVAKKIGEETSGRFEFQSDRPIPSGGKPVSGGLSMRVEYADGTFLVVDGRVSAKEVDVIITDRQGKRLHVVWDRLGRGKSIEEL